MKVLILTLTVGQGHNSTSKALAGYLKSRGAEVDVLDTYKYLNKLIGNVLDKGYIAVLKTTPKSNAKMFEKGLKASRENKTNKFFPYRFHKKGVKTKMKEYIDALKPDIIVCPHIFTAILMTQMRENAMLERGVALYGIVTDFMFHPFWEHTSLDYYVLASETLVYPAKKLGLPEDKLLPLGIPVNEEFSGQADAAEARKKLGLKEALTILVLGGSMGFGDMLDILEKIDKMPVDKNIIFVSGANKRLYNSVRGHDFKSPSLILGFAKNINELMNASDIVVTKPGGISVSEALAKVKPLIVTEPIPGGEERNLHYLLNNGLAMYAGEHAEIDEVIDQFIKNKLRAVQMADCQRALGKRHSAKKLGDFMIERFEAGTLCVSGQTHAGR